MLLRVWPVVGLVDVVILLLVVLIALVLRFRRHLFRLPGHQFRDCRLLPQLLLQLLPPQPML
jgi:hypothetical protein